MPPVISNEDALAAHEAAIRLGSNKAAANELGVQEHTVARRRGIAVRRNLVDSFAGGEQPSGFIVSKTSTLYDAQTGEAKLQWIKTDREREAFADTLESIRETLSEVRPLPKVTTPAKINADLVTVYPIADHHLGLYAWAEESGDDYDLKTGVEILRNSVAQVSQSAPASETGLVLVLGDFFHADSNLLRTLRSNHPLDHDGRWQKVLREGVHLIRDVINMARRKHDKVILHVIPGNHDDHSSAMLSVGMEMAFDNEPRVEIDMGASRIWCRRFGEVLIAAAHGDMAKPADLPGAIAANHSMEWGQSKHRQIFTGHIHHQTRLEKHGAIVESMSTLAAKDAYAAGMGYNSQRSMCAITYHKERGEYVRNTVTV